MNPPQPGELSADGILIRPWQRHDVDALYAAARESIDSVGRWLPWCHPAYTHVDSGAWIDHCQAQWNANKEYPFAVLSSDDQRLLGGVGLNRIDPAQQTANLGYWVRTSAQGHGAATAAVRLASGFGFKRGLLRLEIVAALDNLASRRIAEKAGARYAGIVRDRVLLHGKPVAAALYALVPPAQNAA